MKVAARKRCICLCASVLAAAAAAGSAYGSPGAAGETAVLCKTYFRYLLSQEVSAQALTLSRDAVDSDAGQIRDAATAWSGRQMVEIRKVLQTAFGKAARQRFEGFVTMYTTGEQAEDSGMLRELSAALELDPAPADYSALRRAVVQGPLADDMIAASQWLGEIQTWMDVRRKNKDTPVLEAWLTRSEPAEAASGWQWKKTGAAPAGRPAASAPANPLASAEPEMGEYQDEGEEAGSPLDTFGELRKKKREKALEEAQAGMQQVADERRAAEEEYGQKKLAEAQAEAENIKRQAEKLAAVEKEALDQRQNSWSARLKKIVGSTISAATGAFTGGIGTRAGEEAADALFEDD